MCVDITRRPSAKATFSGHVVFRLLWTGIPSMTNICVAPESAIASFAAIVNAAYAHLDACLGTHDEENADSRGFVGCVRCCIRILVGAWCVRVRIWLLGAWCVPVRIWLLCDPVEARLDVEPVETFDVTTVMSSSSTIIVWAGE